MAAHSSILAWKMLWTEKPGGLQSIGLQRVRHDAKQQQGERQIARPEGIGKALPPSDSSTLLLALFIT